MVIPAGFAVGRRIFLPVLLAMLVITAGMFHLWEYFNGDLTRLAGLCIGLALGLRPVGGPSLRLVFPALFFLVLCFVFPVLSVYYFACAFGLLAIQEGFSGKVSLPVIAVPVFVSPLMRYVSTGFSVPLKLWLTEASGKILSLITPVKVEGNLFSFLDRSFLVDDACAGMSMVQTGLLAAILIPALAPSKHKGRMLPVLALFVTAAIALTIFSNLVRILLLALFNCGPESLFHPLTGLLTFAVFVLLPLLWLGSRGTDRGSFKGRVEYPPAGRRFLLVLLAATVALTGSFRKTGNETISGFVIPGFQKEEIKNGILKFWDGETLIYAKPVSWYAAEHSPAVCWRGSGYSFYQTFSRKEQGLSFYEADLEKEGKVLNTAWWMEVNGRPAASQWEWRWESLKSGTPAVLINVTTTGSKKLREAMAEYREKAGQDQRSSASLRASASLR